jgi:outer membrane protein assembly factor BamE (lipoprotein component of BamABCDE complex)
MEKRKLFAATLAALGLAALLAGCATPLDVNKIMQEPAGTRYYTAYNIWYNGDQPISSINQQSGTLIPFGTPINVIKATKWTLKFKDLTTGKEHVIVYREKYGMEPMEGFLKKFLTTKNAAEIHKGIPQRIVDAMKRGIVLKGMTKKQVAITYGPPSPHRTPSWDNETWIYWKNRWDTKRVIFKNGKVIEILE